MCVVCVYLCVCLCVRARARVRGPQMLPSNLELSSLEEAQNFTQGHSQKIWAPGMISFPPPVPPSHPGN